MCSVFSLDRHAVIYRDSVFFQKFSSGSRKVAIVGSAFEVTHEISLEQGQIQGNSGEISCPADKVPNWQPPRILLGIAEARLVNVNKHTHPHQMVKSQWYITCDQERR